MLRKIERNSTIPSTTSNARRKARDLAIGRQIRRSPYERIEHATLLAEKRSKHRGVFFAAQ